MSDQSVALRPEKAGEIMESVIARGDLSKLDAAERAKYYTRVCESMGLNPLTKPFDYITLNGKLTLYALKTATDQLRKIYGVSVVDMSEKREGDLIVVTVKVQDATGRTDMSKGALSLGNLKGEALANAIMKAETKAKRRATLSICGLGFLDETEVESIHAAPRVLKKDAKADYHQMLAELDHALHPGMWAGDNAERIRSLPPEWQANIETVIEAKAVDRTATSGEILSERWSDQQAQNLGNAMRAHEPPDDPPEWDSKWDALGPVKQAGILCNEEMFWKFLSLAGRNIENADQAAVSVRNTCGVKSRSQLATDDLAAKKWRTLIADYRVWQRADEPSPRPTHGEAPGAGDPPPAAAPASLAAGGEVAIPLEDEAREAAQRGEDVFKAFYKRLTRKQQDQLTMIGEELRELMNNDHAE